MQPTPSSAWFIHAFEAGKVRPEHFVGLRGLAPAFYCGLFHSAAAAETLVGQSNADSSAEWSLLLLAPDDSQQLDKQSLELDDEFLPRLDMAAQEARVADSPVCPVTNTVLPFASGWQLYLSYELAAEVEPVLASALTLSETSIVAQARRVRGAVLFNHRTEQAWCCLESEQAALLSRIDADLASLRTCDETVAVVSVEEEAETQFTKAVTKTLDYIRDGDIFQANLSRGWRLQLQGEPSSQAIYSQLIAKNPAPFSAWMSIADSVRGEGGFELISSSPERLVEIEVNSGEAPWVNTRPIAGTRPRNPEAEKDQHYLKELQQSPKENAEHLMLIDLERNDLGRVCQPGSIEVNELMTIESFAHVHHIVSNVRGRKRAGVSVGEVIAAVFPGGTITGCPKVRCMEIIAELEQCQRGAYTGAVGYLGLNGQLDLNIVIRSLVRENASPDTLTLRAGAGIVADSDPAHELAETRAKANSVLRAFAGE